MADGTNISLSSVKSGSGWFTVNGAGTYRVKELESGMVSAATADASSKTLVMTSHATVGVVDDTKNGGWTITLGGKKPVASVVSGDIVYGTSGNDSVSLSGSNIQLFLGNGNDSVVSNDSSNNILVDAGAGNDSISIKGNSVTVQAGAGDDFVSVMGDSAYLYGGNGADSIVAVGSSVVIDAGDGNDSVTASLNGGTVDLGAGNDYASIDGDKVLITAGTGNDTVSIGGSQVTVYGGDGNDSIVVGGDKAEIYGDAGNDVISIGGASVTAYGGVGADTISVQGTNAVIDAGAGADSVIVAANDATITLGDGRDTVSIGATGVSLTDYTYGTDTLIIGNGLGADSTKAGNDVSFNTTGLISTAGAQAQITSTDGYYKAALSKAVGGSQSYAWASDTSSTIDLSSATDNFYVLADLNDTVGDSVVGGRGNDSIIVGSNDTVNGGRGNDSISIAANASAVTVALTANGGTDTVNGASISASSNLFGFTDDAISLYVDDASKLSFDFGGTASVLRASIKGATAEFTNATADAASNHLDLKVNAAGTTTNYEIVKDGAVIDDGAQVFYGVAAGTSVSVGSGVSNTYIDLSNQNQFGDTHTYVNVNKIDATNSDGEDVLIGGTTATTIAAGKGKTTIFGAGSAGDSLAGGEGDDTFVFGTGYGNDTVANYGASGSDTLFFLQGVSAYTKDSAGLHLASGSDSLTVQNVSSQGGKEVSSANIVYTIQTLGNDAYTAKVGVTASANTFTYDEDVQYYLGGSKTDTVTLTGNDDHDILLGGKYKGTTYSSIEVLDASAASGDLLIWGATNENDTIKAGTGNSTIFGGFGSSGNDVLTGNSSGTTTFEFGLGCGNDTITSSKSTDSIYLYNASVSDLDMDKTAAGTTNSALKLVLTDGSTLTVSGISTGAKTLVLQDSTWTYDTKTGFTKVQ